MSTAAAIKQRPRAGAVFLSKSEVLARYGTSNSWLTRRIAGGFPKPVHLGGSQKGFWKLADVEAWEANADHVAPPINVEPRT